VPPPEAVMDLAAVVDGLAVSAAGVRLAARDRWHVTVVFIGEAPVQRTATAVRKAAEGTGVLRLRFAGGGTFGHRGSTILWSGVDGDLAALRHLSTAVRAGLRRVRLPYDRKPLRPHLTISRPGALLPAEAVAADAATLAGYVGPLWTATSVHLVASEMEQTATGPSPRYTTLVEIAL
jgi:RNA 2',3'-cyclic 3'-phosphodiesterase